MEVEYGTENKGLKVISQQLEVNKLVTEVEGIAGESYKLGLTNSNKIKKVKGGKISGNELIVEISDSADGKEFIKHFIEIEF